MTEDRRANLKDYYQQVLVCSLCKQEYGLDTPKGVKDYNDNMTCPICEQKVIGKSSRFEQ